MSGVFSPGRTLSVPSQRGKGVRDGVKIEMRTTLPDAEQDALEAWVDEHGDEFDTVAVYRQGITMYLVGVPPTTVVHHPGRITAALVEALASVVQRTASY